MLFSANKAHDRHQRPSSAERWLIGALAGAGLAYLLGKAMGLGKSPLSAKKPTKKPMP